MHAFDVLRRVLRRIYGDKSSMRSRVDLDAMFIWSNMHGLATLTQSNVMGHLASQQAFDRRAAGHVMTMMGRR